MTEKPGSTAIYPCSGGSNLGQIANTVGIKLTEAGMGNMSCTAGIGAHEVKFVEGGKSASRVIAIDGCALACAKKSLEQAGIPITRWICITDYGIKKTPNKFEIQPGELERALNGIRKALAST
jgi:uncharacterized metal-binding protein